jgi:nucleoside phosphorylase
MSSIHGADLLILAAHAPELLGLRDALGTELSGMVGSVRVVCATVGVGLPAAAAGTMRHVRDARPRAVLLLGSCGLYPRRVEFQPLQAVVPTEVRLVDASVIADQAAFPAPMQLVREPDPRLSDALALTCPTALRGAVATTLGITTDDSLARTLGRKSGCAAENLEAFSVALACGARDLPFASLLVATNEVGSQGREQWRTHQREAAERGARVVLDWIERGAPGL